MSTALEALDTAVAEASRQHPEVDAGVVWRSALGLLSEADRSDLEEQLHEAEIAKEIRRVAASTGKSHDLLTACVAAFVEYQKGKQDYERLADRAQELSDVYSRMNARAATSRTSLNELLNAAIEKQVETVTKAHGGDFEVTGFGKVDAAQQEVNRCLLVIDGLTKTIIPNALQHRDHSKIQLYHLEAMASSAFADLLDALTMERAQSLMALQGPGVAVDTSKSRSGGFRARAKQLLSSYNSGISTFRTIPSVPRLN